MNNMLNNKTGYGLAALSGILLLLSYPPFNFGSFLAWFALVPLIVAIYNETKVKRMDRLLCITGIFLAPVFIWLYNEFDVFLPSIIAWPLGIILALLTTFYVTWHVEDYWKPKQLPRKELAYLPSTLQVLIIPIVGTAVEFLLMNLPAIMKIGGGIGFVSLSRTQWMNTPILQLASFTGMYGVTFLILLVNCALAYMVIHYKETKKISKQAIAVLFIFGAIFAYGLVSIPELSAGDTTVIIIQAQPKVMETEYVNELYFNLTKNSLKYNPEIILWSDWMNYEPFETVGPYTTQYVNFSKEHNIYLTNSEDLVYPDGKTERHEAPFLNAFPAGIIDGFVPFDLSKILPRTHGYDTKLGRLGILLCIESASTIPARQLIEDGTQFIIVTSCDRPVIGAFQGLIGGNAVYRAVEHRVYTALFFGSSGSIIIDPYGRIIQDTAPEPEIVAGKVSFTNKRTFYTKYGDVFGWAVVALALALFGYDYHLKKKAKAKPRQKK
ncbi:MAG: hypothetical protein KAW41_00380 [Candidatus Diapherotrites archaeon]|nr:hypothetical protein [Candidatus Diapherotrites archaeon]